MSDESNNPALQDPNSGAAIDVVSHEETDADRDQRSSLVDKLAAQLDQFNDADEEYPFELGDESSEDEAEDDDSQDEGVGDDEDEVEDDTDDDDDLEVEDQEAATSTDGQSAGVPTLPAAYRRSLLAEGFTEADIDQNSAASPNGFLNFAKTVHDQRNAKTAAWAEQGRRLAEQEQQGPAQQGAVPGTPALPNQLNLPDIETIRERVEDDKIVDEIIAPILAVGQTLQQILPTVQQGLQSVQQVEQQRTDDYINKFFSRDEMKPYTKLYGGPEKDLTPEQVDARQQVIQEAIFIFKGKQASGIDGSVGDALQAAHDTVAADFKEVAVRKSIKKKVKQRNRGIQQRPSKRADASGSRKTTKGAPKDRQDLELRTADRMAAAFKNI